MHPDLLDILTPKEAPLNNELLAKYLEGSLDEAARNEVERLLLEGGILEEDALEGWEAAKNKTQLPAFAQEINKKLLTQLHESKKRKRKGPITSLPILWWIIGLVLLLVIMAWVIISLLQ